MESWALERMKGRIKKETKLKEAGRFGSWQPIVTIGCHFLHKIGSHVSSQKLRGKEGSLVFDRNGPCWKF